MPMKREEVIGLSCLLYGTVFWGLVWYPYRLLELNQIYPISASSLTFMVASILALVFIFPKRHDDILLNLKSLVIFALVGCVTNISYVIAVVNGNVVRSMLLFFMSPLWTIFLSYFLIPNDTFQKKDAYIALLSIVGGFVILFDPNSFLMNVGFSDFFALLAGIFFACTNVLARKFSEIHYQSKSFAIWVGVAVGGALLILITNDLNVINLINPKSLILILIIGLLLFCSTLIIQYGLPKINPVKASPIFTFEIVVAALSSYWLANEILGVKDLVGGVFIILAISLSALK